MKKIISVLLIIITAALLFSCGEDEREKSDTTAREKDWRNSIEYEGSFYVNEHKKLLYALDKGSVTLWDNGGTGEVLQTLKYDSAVSDVMSKVETEDFNGDGNRDVRIIYSDTEKGKNYSLWLWSEEDGSYSKCAQYSLIMNPTAIDEKTVSGEVSLGIFGTLKKVYAFGEGTELDLVEITLEGADTVAAAIAEAFVSGEVYPAEGVATVGDVECTAYVVRDGDKETAYIAYDDDANWYIDTSLKGLYRALYEDGGKFVLGDNTGDAAEAVRVISGFSGQNDVAVTDKETGILSGFSATLYTAVAGDAVFRTVHSGDGGWYLVTEADTLCPIYISSASLGEPIEAKFEK